MTPAPRRPGDLLVRTGAVLFAVGLLAVLAVFVPFLAGRSDEPPLAYDLVALLLPGGFGLALVGLLRSARAEHVVEGAGPEGRDGHRPEAL